MLPIYSFSSFLLPEIQASMSKFLVNFSNLRSYAQLIFIQSRPFNSRSLPQSFLFLWMTSPSTWLFRTEFHVSSLFSLLPFLGPRGPSYQQTLLSLPLSDASSQTASISHPSPKPHSCLIYATPRASYVLLLIISLLSFLPHSHQSDPQSSRGSLGSPSWNFSVATRPPVIWPPFCLPLKPRSSLTALTTLGFFQFL